MPRSVAAGLLSCGLVDAFTESGAACIETRLPLASAEVVESAVTVCASLRLKGPR